MVTMQKGLKGTNLFKYCENNVMNRNDITGKFSLKQFAKRSANWICKVSRFAKLIDLIIILVPVVAGIVSAYNNARKAQQMAQSVAGVASKKMVKCLKSLSTKLVEYANKQIKTLFLSFIPTIVDCILTVIASSIGTIIAKTIDRFDKKRNNGYCFNF